MSKISLGLQAQVSFLDKLDVFALKLIACQALKYVPIIVRTVEAVRGVHALPLVPIEQESENRRYFESELRIRANG